MTKRAAQHGGLPDDHIDCTIAVEQLALPHCASACYSALIPASLMTVPHFSSSLSM